MFSPIKEHRPSAWKKAPRKSACARDNSVKAATLLSWITSKHALSWHSSMLAHVCAHMHVCVRVLVRARIKLPKVTA